jgi:hypothetical protein
MGYVEYYTMLKEKNFPVKEDASLEIVEMYVEYGHISLQYFQF